ncbi:hypothetical protein T06_3487 [Trichinella sp. T6]|nr:hypothetical protein T06_3487 [Trichinella sp. T6]
MGTKALGSRMSGRSSNSLFQASQGLSTSSWNGSSQSSPRPHNDWKGIFARTRNGARHLIWSKILDATLNSCRFVFPPSGRRFSAVTKVR